MKLVRKTKTTLSKIGRNHISWGLFLCERCGKEVEKQLSHGKRDKSCGCKQYECHYKHGDCVNGVRTRLCETWKNMKSRCYASSCINYKNYGGRGIIVCKEWINSYKTFKDWTLKNGYRDDLQIDRINNDGDYEPENCRFVSQKRKQS